jgi:hypothetical protein
MESETKFLDILYLLYSEDPEKNLEAINQSKHALQFILDDESDLLLIHTGFIFKIQTGTEFHLIYDFYSNTLFRANYKSGSDFPHFLGLICSCYKGYINTYHSQDLMTHLSSSEPKITSLQMNENFHLVDIDLPTFKIVFPNKVIEQQVIITKFEIIDRSNNTIVDSFPLFRNLPWKVFLGRNVFSEFNEDFHDN